MASKTIKRMLGFADDHPEKLKESPQHLNPVKSQLAELINPVNFIDQIFGNSESAQKHAQPENHEQPVRHRKGIIFSLESKHQTHSERAMEQETHAVLDELKKQVKLLEKTEKSLNAEIKKISVDSVTEKKGVYYLRFFEWLIGVIRQLRMKAEEGQSWLQAFNGRGKKKKGYWQMFKKHGTTFGMSNERSLATSAG